jgi:starch phosphorylase
MPFDEYLSQKPPNQFNLPQRIHRLSDLSYNLWWTWHAEAERAYRFIDPVVWEGTRHNPVRFLRQVERQKLDAAIQDSGYLEIYDRVIQAFDEYMADVKQTWYIDSHPERIHQPIAYFSTEFGLHETLPIYAGGLGILSGDHLKEASDLGIPMVAVGFLYTQGYFIQRITEDGWQEDEYKNLSFQDLPVFPVVDEHGDKLTVNVPLGEREVQVCMWRVQVGRTPLFLLDSNVEQNRPSDRNLTARLYTSDLDSRISQEIILGVGGVRALRALGYNPCAWHMNEGHSAFMALERVREMTGSGTSFDAALEKVRASTIFTTHTPVPAGHDEFPLPLIDQYFEKYWPKLGLDRDSFIKLALHTQEWGERFSMAILAFRMSEHCNGVSELHGRVARKMWSFLWPDRPVEEVPIGHITNGIHTSTWVARRMGELFKEFLAADWENRLDDSEVWEYIDRIPDHALWDVRRHLKRKMTDYLRERARPQWLHGNDHPVQVIASGALLEPYALTIGFARRFATYKRADLILRDVDRLLRLLNRPDMPVQLIFAGKAHPADEPGKRLIQEIYHQVKRAENGGRLVFVEDYDMNLARYLIQGVDVWLNTPRRPNEASGTSGQKAALNGVLNFSILDGWWIEGYDGENGWAIGTLKDFDNPQAQDEADAESLYHVLEDEIIPLYYQRSADNMPGEWLRRVKRSIQSLAPRFSMRRMVKEYVNDMYLPALPNCKK